MNDRLLTEREAAEVLGLAHTVLRTYRRLGFGPDYARLGNGSLASPVRYRRSDLDAWIASRIVQPATSPTVAA